MAAPVAIQLAGALEMTSGGGLPKTPTSPVSPTSPGLGQSSFKISPSPFANLNVRDVFETNGLEQTREVSKRVNLEIEKKREELRTLVGERYRDLIDAADTIGSMSSSSASIFQSLGSLRRKMSTIPTQLSAIPKTRSTTDGISCRGLNKEELEIAFELKLSLEAPRVVQKYLDEKMVVSAAHLSVLFDRSLRQNDKPCTWTFLSNSGNDSGTTTAAICNSILRTCDEMMESFETSPEKLAECIVTKQVLSDRTCNEVIAELLSRRIQMSEQILLRSDSVSGNANEFVESVASTLNDIYIMLIDGQVYNFAVKEMRRPKISMSSFGIKYTPRIVHTFSNEQLNAEDPPRAGMLAQLLLESYVLPLKNLLSRCFEKRVYLVHQQSFLELNDYQKSTTKILKEKTDDLMRIVLGTSKSLWSETFYPVFQQKCEQVGKQKIDLIFKHLVDDTFPKFKQLDEGFDLVSFIWKTAFLKKNQSSNSQSLSSSKEVDLKLKCVSPQVADICADVEENFVQFLKDFQTLGDFSLKKYISAEILERWRAFLNETTTTSKSFSLFMGRFVSSLASLCPTIWKLVDMKDGAELRACFSAVSEKCWTQWAMESTEKFNASLGSKLERLENDTVAVLMPVAEDFVPEGEDSVKPSVRVPLQISHVLHSNLFELCHDLSRVGPQSVPKSVREELRKSIGSKVISFYKTLLDEAQTPVSPQTALQLIFDIKFCQWFHLQLKELADPVIKNLQSVIDPFDMDIVSPRLKANLKRFLFETHLTLGLLFSEESHSFIAQNFKTKMNMSFPVSISSLRSPLPVLPV